MNNKEGNSVHAILPSTNVIKFSFSTSGIKIEMKLKLKNCNKTLK